MLQTANATVLGVWLVYQVRCTWCHYGIRRIMLLIKSDKLLHLLRWKETFYPLYQHRFFVCLLILYCSNKERSHKTHTFKSVYYWRTIQMPISGIYLGAQASWALWDFIKNHEVNSEGSFCVVLTRFRAPTFVDEEEGLKHDGQRNHPTIRSLEHYHFGSWSRNVAWSCE